MNVYNLKITYPYRALHLSPNLLPSGQRETGLQLAHYVLVLPQALYSYDPEEQKGFCRDCFQRKNQTVGWDAFPGDVDVQPGGTASQNGCLLELATT